MPMIEAVQRGTPLKLSMMGEKKIANVIMASENGKSLMVCFEGFLGGYICMMPLLYTGDGYIELIGGREVLVEAGDETL